MSKKASLRVCMSCQWVYRTTPETHGAGCPKCGWPSYGARYVFGASAPTYERTQKPWFDKKISDRSMELQRIIADNLATFPKTNLTLKAFHE